MSKSEKNIAMVFFVLAVLTIFIICGYYMIENLKRDSLVEELGEEYNQTGIDWDLTSSSPEK